MLDHDKIIRNLAICMILIICMFFVVFEKLKQKKEQTPTYLEHAKSLSLKNICEIPGDDGNHPWIISALTAMKIENPTDEMGWCASGLNKILHESGYIGTNSALAKSFLNWGKSIKDSPKLGAICIFFDGENYHATILAQLKIESLNMGESFLCIGCNQGGTIRTSPYLVKTLVDMRYPTKKEMIVENSSCK